MNILLAFPDPFLSNGWRDVIAVAGLVATFLTILAFALAVYQIRKTQSAAEAATRAEKDALNEVQIQYRRFSANNAHHLVRNVKADVHKQQWDMAALQLSFLADQLVQLAGADESWKEIIARLRQWEASCHRQAAGKTREFASEKWIKFTVSLESKIDHWSALFPSDKENENDAARDRN
jgi:Tfp pilus assembly protein PilV